MKEGVIYKIIKRVVKAGIADKKQRAELNLRTEIFGYYFYPRIFFISLPSTIVHARRTAL